MLFADRFNDKIMKMIERFSYDMYLIARDVKISCPCVNHATYQADPSCRICLGTGKKITIRKVRAAAQDTKLPPTFRSDKFVVARSYFLPSRYGIKEDDIMMDEGVPYIIFEIQQLKGLEGKVPYNKISAVRKKFDSKQLMDNFQRIIDMKSIKGR